jgi:hypothetical protein
VASQLEHGDALSLLDYVEGVGLHREFPQA